MNIHEIKTLFDGLVDDAYSAGFFKKFEAVKHHKKAQLVELINQANAIVYPHCSHCSVKVVRETKISIVRYLAFAVSRIA